MTPAEKAIKDTMDWANESANAARREYNRECCDKFKKGIQSGKIKAFEQCAAMLDAVLTDLGIPV